MTKEQAKQKVLDAVADLAQVELDASGDYLHFLDEVEDAVSDRISRLSGLEVSRTGIDPRFRVLTSDEIDALGAADLNLRAAERAEGGEKECCGFGCGSACVGFGPADHVHDDDIEEEEE